MLVRLAGSKIANELQMREKVRRARSLQVKGVIFAVEEMQEALNQLARERGQGDVFPAASSSGSGTFRAQSWNIFLCRRVAIQLVDRSKGRSIVIDQPGANFKK